MWLIIAAVVVVICVVVGVLAFAGSKKSTSCIYVTSPDGINYTCTCSSGSAESDCATKNGLWNSTSRCDDSFGDKCRSQLLGTCKTSNSCFYPTTKEVCSKNGGTWDMGKNSC